MEIERKRKEERKEERGGGETRRGTSAAGRRDKGLALRPFNLLKSLALIELSHVAAALFVLCA